jgi:hypothetical protein
VRPNDRSSPHPIFAAISIDRFQSCQTVVLICAELSGPTSTFGPKWLIWVPRAPGPVGLWAWQALRAGPGAAGRWAQSYSAYRTRAHKGCPTVISNLKHQLVRPSLEPRSQKPSSSVLLASSCYPGPTPPKADGSNARFAKRLIEQISALTAFAPAKPPCDPIRAWRAWLDRS